MLRVRLTSGDHTDVTCEEPDADDENEVIEHVLFSLLTTPACFAADMVTGSW